MTVEIVIPDSYEAATEDIATSQQSAEQEGEQADEILVSCRCESAKTVATLLQCLRHVATGGTGSVEHHPSASRATNEHAFASQTKRSSSSKFGTGGGTATHQPLQPVTVFCSPSCLTFHMYGTAKQCQASVDLQVSLFSHYQVAQAHPTNDEGGGGTVVEDWQAGGEFCVNLTKVLECLHVLGGHHHGAAASTHALDKTQLSFTYNASSEVFRLELLDRDSGIMITAAIPGMIPPEDDLGTSLALAFRSSPVASRMIVKSDTLKEIVQELELVSGATQGTVSLSPNGLELAAVGHLGECLVSIPCQGDHIVSLELGDASVPAKPRTFPLHSLLASMSGLDIAQETCITINTAGMMAIQHQVVDPALGGNPSFVDFILCCMEDDENDEEEEEGDEHSSQQSQSQTQTSNHLPPAPSEVELVERRTRNDPTTRGTAAYSDGDDSTEDGGEERGLSIRPSIPLFGSLVTGTRSTASSPGESYDRSSDDGSPDKPWHASQRLRRRRHENRSFSSTEHRRTVEQLDKRRRTHRENDDDNYNYNDSSVGDVAEDEKVGNGHDEDDEDDAELEDASQPLDVTMAVAASQHSPRDHDDGCCSSPELVYGRQE